MSPTPESTVMPIPYLASVPETVSENTKVTLATANGPKESSESIPRRHGTGDHNHAPPVQNKGDLRFPKLGSHLDGLVASVEAGQTSAEEAAKDSAVHSEAKVAVTLFLSSNVDEVIDFLEKNDGDPRNVGEDYVEAYVPVTLLGALSEHPGVLRIREFVSPGPEQAGQAFTGQDALE